jgi:hypothetical protein
VQLADQAGFGGFPLINLTAWKLPHACQVFTLWAFADENPPIDVDEGAGDDKQNLGQIGPAMAENRCGKYSAGPVRRRPKG